MEIKGRNVNACYRAALEYINLEGVLEDSRNGRVLVAPEPVLTTYARPLERVLFDPKRDANPFFHLLEAVWMLAGRRDSAFLTYLNVQMKEYANEDGNYDGAYGYRWRIHFGLDQIKWVVDHLKTDPNSRRCVMVMYDIDSDQGTPSLDIPCNTHIYFDTRGGKANMTVCNRSNDLVWGCYGANAVHFSALLEVVAAGLGLPVGVYRQFSNNLHIYIDIRKVSEAVNYPVYRDMYATQGFYPFPMVKNYDTFLRECELFCEDPIATRVWDNPFFYFVAQPMYRAWSAWKREDLKAAYAALRDCEDMAWKYAAEQWLIRRRK